LTTPIESFFLNVQGRELEVQRLGEANARKPAIVFLHDGLGSISTWRDFPRNLAQRTGCPAIVYSRHGYGNSELFPGERQRNYLHDEALRVLPELLDTLGIGTPILFGHSDGASIALIYAGANHSAKALILLAPHVFVEDLTVQNIAAAKLAFETTDMPEKLARHHKNPQSVFWNWNSTWMHSEFRNWNIEEFLPQITCPVLAIQGLDDPYGTLAQLDAIERQVPARVDRVHLKNCRHSPHRDHPQRVLELSAAFVHGF
jgi:pimeloyl-ACP methyl ester carboxylesterase